MGFDTLPREARPLGASPGALKPSRPGARAGRCSSRCCSRRWRRRTGSNSRQVRDVVTMFIKFGGDVLLGGVDPGDRLLARQPRLQRNQRAERRAPEASRALRGLRSSAWSSPWACARWASPTTSSTWRSADAGRGRSGRRARLRPRRPRSGGHADGALAVQIQEGHLIDRASGRRLCALSFCIQVRTSAEPTNDDKIVA